jgi:hypothetical protein
MKNREDLRTRYAQRFGLPESAIDESILPILLALDENTEVSKKLTEKVKGSIVSEQHYYYNPISAWFGMSAKFFFPSVTACVLGLVIYWGIENQNKSKEIQVDLLMNAKRADEFKQKYPELYNKYFGKTINLETNERGK